MKVISERLVMEPISEKDWTLFYQLHTDPKVISFCFNEPSILEIEAKFQSRLIPWSRESSHWLCLVVSELATDKKIGIIGFCLHSGVAEVGFLFLPKYHGLGYGSESLSALLNYSHLQIGIERYSAVVTEGNIGSEKVLTKSGFVLDKIVPNAYEIGGQLYADHIYQRINIVT
ncbi:GNAT family N-acetyltransferase [Vibrio ostreae]|uniref:GNAT family N-acetyltransferase n=1 Tax=Vibrio ostreae TaxID=2841925 RepID=A0A975YPI2_9VIBR|nr:GNAT family N-acetyltransferase [Vibrio ostreae]QXO18828.1 GNAT family N-acetyltransferase [Vibrio ostreae]